MENVYVGRRGKKHRYIPIETIHKMKAGDQEAMQMILDTQRGYILTILRSRANTYGVLFSQLPVDELVNKVMEGLVKDLQRFK